VAHLGYFRTEFVTSRAWLSEPAFADLVALAQFLPGPASSQTGFAIGLRQGGYRGGLAAWLGFTLPSALLMLCFAASASLIIAAPIGLIALHGLKLAAAAIVGQAVWGMARSLCRTWHTRLIALAGLFVSLSISGPFSPVLVIIAGGMAGLFIGRLEPPATSHMILEPLSIAITPRASFIALTLCAALLAASFLPAHGLALLFAAFYRAGALVFGGGHVVLPMLHQAVVAPGWVSNGGFLAGYGAAQALPGPLFTFAAFLGALVQMNHGAPAGLAGATIALVAIFLPGLLAMFGMLPLWHGLRRRPAAQAAITGVNAATVGLLAAAFYNPVLTSAITGPLDLAIALGGFLLLQLRRTPPLAIVALCIAMAVLRAQF
jgi:chromate transporter